jgi:hypothetical protein
MSSQVGFQIIFVTVKFHSPIIYYILYNQAIDIHSGTEMPTLIQKKHTTIRCTNVILRVYSHDVVIDLLTKWLIIILPSWDS